MGKKQKRTPFVINGDDGKKPYSSSDKTERAIKYKKALATFDAIQARNELKAVTDDGWWD